MAWTTESANACLTAESKAELVDKLLKDNLINECIRFEKGTTKEALYREAVAYLAGYGVVV
jgi:hypothetical protein